MGTWEKSKDLIEKNKIVSSPAVFINDKFVHAGELSKAEKYHFTGSPGLRINGKDIDPLTENAPVVLKSCKIYRTEEMMTIGMKMIPAKKMVREALKSMNNAEETIKSCC